jgi:anti-sigma regulatory factor (Ser/Thr protein kinase)
VCPHHSTALPRPTMDIEVRLEPTALAPREARRFVARELEALGYPELVEDARLMVSELVTNTVDNVPGKPLWVDIRRTGQYLLLEVWDCSTESPIAQDPDFLAEGGRGLHVVDALSIKWSYDILCCGKVIWVLFG